MNRVFLIRVSGENIRCVEGDEKALKLLSMLKGVIGVTIVDDSKEVLIVLTQDEVSALIAKAKALAKRHWLR